MSRKPQIKKPKTAYEIQRDSIKMYRTYMDYHLTILFDALQNNHEDEIAFQKAQLEQIRERLYELRYFRDK